MNAVDALIASRPGFDSMRPASEPNAIRLKDFVYASEGTSNAYLVTTGEGRIVINTGMGFEAPVHKRAFDSVSTEPTRYVLLTQGHVDHVGGVRCFREDGTQVVAQSNNAQCQRDDAQIAVVRRAHAGIWFGHVAARAVAAASESSERFAQDTPTPDLLFDESLRLEVGDLVLELHATPGGETVDSCVVWLADQRILFSGNLFGPLFPHFPNFHTLRGDKYRFAEAYLDSLAFVRSLEPETLITGHFTPIEGRELVRACLDRLEEAVRYVHDETLRGMNAGKSIFSLMREISLPPHLRVGEGYGKVSWAVRTIWESRMGWFRAESTTELYPTRARDVYADVAGAAGVEALVGAGRRRLDAGEPEAALHLAEMALAGDPGHQPALRLSLDAHRALLQRSGGENFWEDGWLTDQIARLERALEAR